MAPLSSTKAPQVAARIQYFLNACNGAGVDCSSFKTYCPNVCYLALKTQNNIVSCLKDTDCATFGGGPCTVGKQSKCSIHTDWACWVGMNNGDCDWTEPCNPLANSGTCSSNPAKGCRNDSDCDNGSCNVVLG